MPKCNRCEVSNLEENHFCTHCGNAFPCECSVCYRDTTRYTRCGHSLCCLCDSRLTKRECPLCNVALDIIARPKPPVNDVMELDSLISDIKLFNCDLIRTLQYRCFRKRFTLHVQYDAKFLIRPILSLHLWTAKAQVSFPMWTHFVSLARSDVLFVRRNTEHLRDIDLQDKDEAFFMMVHIREFYVNSQPT
jgi:hypothetical protein